MRRANFSKVFLIPFILFFLSILSVNGELMDVEINESSHIIRLSSGDYSLVANGTFYFANPPAGDLIYEFFISTELDGLLFYEVTNVSNVSRISNSSSSEIKGYLMNPSENFSFSYAFSGILEYDIYSRSIGSGISVMEYYAKYLDFYPKPTISLDKSARENNSLNVSRRLLSSTVENPSNFTVRAKELIIYKTTVGDPFFGNGEIIYTNENLTLDPSESFFFEHIDDTSTDYSVYWLHSRVSAMTNTTRIIDSNLTIIPLDPVDPNNDGGSSNRGEETSSEEAPVSLEEDLEFIIKKSTNDTAIALGETFEVVLEVANNNNQRVSEVSVFDEIPDGFEVLSVDSSLSEYTDLGGGRLFFKYDSMTSFQVDEIKYILRNNELSTGVSFLKPSRLEHSGLAFFSRGVALLHSAGSGEVNDSKKIFIQKEIEDIDDTFSRVTIKVKNLGVFSVDDILVTDTIDDDSLMKQISQIFFQNKRGVWNIKSLGPGEEWEVTYIVEKGNETDTLPTLFGTDDAEVFGILITSKAVVLKIDDTTYNFERIALGIAMGILLLYIIS